MKRPIRFRRRKTGRGAASAGLYWLGLACASWLWLATGCDGQEPGPAVAAESASRVEAASSPSQDRSGPSRSSASPSAADPRPEREALPVVVFLGTSLTAGYGLPEDEAFPALIQQKIDAAGLLFRVVNAGVSGDTSAGGLRRLGWILRLPISVLVLELGANDMLRGQSVKALETNLVGILERTRKAHPRARFLVAGMRAAPNLGRDYAGAFDAIYPALARRYDAALVPFLLEDVAAVRRLNQADGIHPTAEGHKLIADRIWSRLEPILRQQSAD